MSEQQSHPPPPPLNTTQRLNPPPPTHNPTGNANEDDDMTGEHVFDASNYLAYLCYWNKNPHLEETPDPTEMGPLFEGAMHFTQSIYTCSVLDVNWLCQGLAATAVNNIKNDPRKSLAIVPDSSGFCYFKENPHACTYIENAIQGLCPDNTCICV